MEVDKINISDKLKETIKNKGVQQKWVINEMNNIDRSINLDRSKFSAIICGKRKMTGDELLAFCKAMEISPDIFMKDAG